MTSESPTPKTLGIMDHAIMADLFTNGHLTTGMAKPDEPTDVLYQETGQLLIHDLTNTRERVRILEDNPDYAGTHENLDIPSE